MILRRTASILIVTLAAGCAGAQLAPKVPGEAGLAQGRTIPDASRRNLIYAGDQKHLYILSYPDGELLDSELRQSGSMCSDRRGTVYVAGNGAIVYVYRHGAAAPSRTLKVPGASSVFGCGTDSVTNNLAVAFQCENRSQCENARSAVAVYDNAKGRPNVYPDQSVQLDYCGYDNQGNFFAVGSSGTNRYSLAELPHGRDTFVNYSLNPQLVHDGQVQWDGQYITLQDQGNQVIYRLVIRDGKVKTEGMTRLYGALGPQAESWIHNGTVLVPYLHSRPNANYLGFFDYPAGGDAFKTITNGLGGADPLIGLTVSAVQ